MENKREETKKSNQFLFALIVLTLLWFVYGFFR